MIDRLKQIPKMYLITGIIIILGIFTFFAAPTFSRLIGGIFNDTLEEWKGDIAGSYAGGSGVESDPYLISRPNELAYFAKMLETTDYSDVYFKLTNDLIMNKGIFSYENNMVIYNYNDSQYYLEPYTNNLYSDAIFSDLEDIPMYDFDTITNFKGHLDGDFFSIYGLYITEKDSDNLGLFDNLEGTVENIFIEHSLVYGSNSVSGLAVNVNNSEINNVYVSGLTISNSEDVKSEVIAIQDVEYQTDELVFKIELNNDSLNNKNIVSTKLSGNYSLLNEEEIDLEINNRELTLGDFEIELDNDLSNGIVVANVTVKEDVVEDIDLEVVLNTIKLSNLQLHINYTDTISSGISSTVTNSNLTNVVSMMDIYGANGVGFVDEVVGNTSIINSYNQGNVYTEATSIGFVNKVVGSSELTLTNVYNSGKLLGVKNIGILNSSDRDSIINVTNSFNASDGEFFGNINSGFVNIDNAYNYYLTDDVFDVNVIKNYDTFFTEEFLNMLEFKEFDESLDTVWTYNSQDFPTLYYLNQLNLIEVNVTGNSFINYDDTAVNTYYKEEISVIVSNDAPVYNLANVEYYIDYGTEILDKDLLLNVNWVNYDGPLSLTEEGKHIVYIKLTDYNNYSRIINTGVLNIDMTSPSAEIVLNDNVWSSYTNDDSRVAINDNQPVIVNTSDNSSGVKSIDYIVSDTKLSEDELNNVSWQPYDNGINLDPEGEKIVYARVMDNSNNITLLGTSLLSFDGYSLNAFTVGRTGYVPSGLAINISDKSSVFMNFTYQSSNITLTDFNHVVTSSSSLPVGTKLLLHDKVNDKYYDYVVNDMDVGYNTYNFTTFKELGSLSKFYTASNYVDNGQIVENFDLLVDFSDANITSNINNLSITLGVVDSSNTFIRSTLVETIKVFNIYDNSDAVVNLSSSLTNVDIKYNSDNIIPIGITSDILYLGDSIIDSTLEQKDLVLKLEILDSSNSLVNPNDIKSFHLEVDGVEYYADNKGIFTLDFDTGLVALDKDINLVIGKSDSFLSEGNYNISITSYASFNNSQTGNYKTIMLPLVVGNNEMESNYNFSVDVIGSNVINRDDTTHDLVFNTTLIGVDNPSIKVSLYTKASLSPIDQTYSLVDINDYLVTPITGTLSNDFSLSFDTSKLVPNGYRIVIEAYDGTTLIDSINKNIVVK